MHPKDLFYSLGSSEDVWKRVVSTQKLPWSHEKPPDFFFMLFHSHWIRFSIAYIVLIVIPQCLSMFCLEHKKNVMFRPHIPGGMCQKQFQMIVRIYVRIIWVVITPSK